MDSRWADSTDEEDAGFDAPVEPSEDAVAPQDVSVCSRSLTDRNNLVDEERLSELSQSWNVDQ